MDDRVAVVTGGAAGIGEATCLRLAEAGADVVAVDIDGEGAAATAEEAAEEFGSDAIAVECDTGSEADVEAMAERVEDHYGEVDVLVNNAGIRADPKPVTECSEESWDEILDVNLKGYAFCAKHLIPLMPHNEGANVVNVASVGAAKARSKWSQYDSTKGAIIAMTKDMACDHAEEGIRVNAISPGWIVTDYHIGDRTGEEAEQYVEESTSWGGSSGSIMRRGAKPRELANAVLWLASDEASFVTGVNIPVDGGSSVN